MVAKLLANFKKDILGNILALVTALVTLLATCFYGPAILKNYFALVVVFSVLAIILCIVGTVVDMKGVDLVIDVFLIGFSFGSFLIGRLESLNLMQVNLSDINIYYYIDIVLYIAALALSIITAVVKKENK